MKYILNNPGIVPFIYWINNLQKIQFKNNKNLNK